MLWSPRFLVLLISLLLSLKALEKKKYNTLYVLRNQETKPYIDCSGFFLTNLTRLNGKININQNKEY